jgi:hypothetical protein
MISAIHRSGKLGEYWFYYGQVDIECVMFSWHNVPNTLRLFCLSEPMIQVLTTTTTTTTTNNNNNTSMSYNNNNFPIIVYVYLNLCYHSCIATCSTWFKFRFRRKLTLRSLMSYIYGAPILDVSRSHTTTQHSR